ncbi:hypothetical protein AX16_010199 [Volvariella volvacea WC 439]|nr:hypothetical protein AX16_010199 [Volvariella volvacea WC 439]
MTTNTTFLRQSECTSVPIPEDHSNYWFPHLYFQHADGTFESVGGGAVIDRPGTTTAFPDDFRMLAGDPFLRSYDASNPAQRAVTFLCLDFKGTSVTYNAFPERHCPDGVRAQVNFQSCWDGINTDSPDHKSHVAYPSGGPDSGTCNDPRYPVTLPRIFLEVYWGTNHFESRRSQALNPNQPFVLANGDPTGYGWHADFLNGWDEGVLQRAVDGCNCNIYGAMDCCVERGIFGKRDQNCRITRTVDEQTLGRLPKLPGNNPVTGPGPRAVPQPDDTNPVILSPVYAYTGQNPPAVGTSIGHAYGARPTDPAPTVPAETQPTPTPTPAPEPETPEPETPAEESSSVEPEPSDDEPTDAPTDAPTIPVPTASLEPTGSSSAANQPTGVPQPPAYPSTGPNDGNHNLPSGSSSANNAGPTSTPSTPTVPSTPGNGNNGSGNGSGSGSGSGQCNAHSYKKRSTKVKGKKSKKHARHAHKRANQVRSSTF